MDINIIISGNLTGFSRFYATSDANDLYADAKIDFDYRNYVTFLNDGEKAYAISFAPHFVAVSLITRILDSFRRPGILVVTSLVRRDMMVASVVNPQNKYALYQLLNEINDKFYERNFMNGMINQNPAVLMQDYYSDILSNYRLTSDTNQRRVNATIDINSVNKRLGFVASNETDIPLYLSSLYRRNYEGYHHVFLAPNAPQNIDETPVELALYRVYITNNKMTLPGLVKLADQVYQLNPNPGEIPFDQNYTYGDVLNGKAGTQIKASIMGETLEVTYRFKEEEKTIHFIFEDKAQAIPLAQIAPVIQESDGTRYNLSSESFKFIGREIYGPKTVKSTNPHFIIKPESSVLDLQRLNDGATCHIQVESSSVLEWRFTTPNDVSKTIKLTRRGTYQTINIPNVTGYLYRDLPGDLSEWDYTIEAQGYFILSGNVGSPASLELKPKPVASTPVIPARTSNSSMVTSKSNVPQLGKLKLSDGGNVTKKRRVENKLNIKKLLLVVVPFLLIVTGVIYLFIENPWGGEEEHLEVTKEVTVVLKDNANYNFGTYKDSLLLEVYFGNDLVKGDGNKYKFTALNNEEKKIRFCVSCKQYKKVLYDDTYGFEKLENEIVIKLNICESALKLYYQLLSLKNKDNITPDDLTNIQDSINKVKNNNANEDFFKCIKDLYGEVDKKKPTIQSKDASEKSEFIRDNLDSVTLTLEQVKGSISQTHAESLRLEALKSVLDKLIDGKIPTQDDCIYLSEKMVDTIHEYQLSQKQIVEDLITIYDKADDQQKSDIKIALKKKNESLFKVYDVVMLWSNILKLGIHEENITRKNKEK